MKVKGHIDPRMTRRFKDSMQPLTEGVSRIRGIEYLNKRLPRDSNDLSKYGAEGWELITVAPCLDDPAMLQYFFKRKIEN